MIIILVVIAAAAAVFLWLFLSGKILNSVTGIQPEPSSSQFSSATEKSGPSPSASAQASTPEPTSSPILNVDPKTILNELPVKKDMKDGEYAAQINNVFKVGDGYAIDLDELEETGDKNYNESNIIVFVPVSEDVVYTKDEKAVSQDIAGFETALGDQDSASFYLVTVEGGVVTNVEYKGTVDKTDAGSQSEPSDQPTSTEKQSETEKPVTSEKPE